MITKLKKIASCTVSTFLGCVVLSAGAAISQQVSPEVNNITGSWQFAGSANAPSYLRITHNTTSSTPSKF